MNENIVTQRREDGHQKSAYNLILKEKLLETGKSSINRTLKDRKE